MIRIGGVTPLTTIDFPGRLAAVLFLQGCPWRCSYCQNPDLLPARGVHELDWSKWLHWLQRRRGLLDGVVFTGGEPTLQPTLPAAMAQVRAMGFQIALHTGGSYPERLRRLLPLVDWIGLDIKAPLSHHEAVVGRRNAHVAAQRALAMVLASGIDYECRTTWHPTLFGFEHLQQLGHALQQQGVRHWVIQPARIEGQPIAANVLAELDHWVSGFSSFSIRR